MTQIQKQSQTQVTVPLQPIDPNMLSQMNSPNSTVLTTFVGVGITLSLLTVLVLGILSCLSKDGKESGRSNGKFKLEVEWGGSETSTKK